MKPGYTVTVRTRYQRYIGEFVLHCHILDHEDQGMMQNVAIVLPGGTPASVNAPEEGGTAATRRRRPGTTKGPALRRGLSLVAGAGFEPATFRL